MRSKYIFSTFVLAHGVLRKNFKLLLILGSLIKQFIGSKYAICSQPSASCNSISMRSSVIPCNGSPKITNN